MSDEESGQLQEQVTKIKDEAERKFGCPCGKWYLSYPALFTHVKQKHEGKPPGQLIKPKTDKTRGRPRLANNNNEEQNSIVNYDCVDELEKALQNRTIDYEDSYDTSDGNETCQDMGSHFLRIMGSGSGEQRKFIICFLNYLRFTVNKKYQQGFWDNKKPSQIIDVTNDLVREHENNQQAFPIQKDTLVDLIYVFFRWMYKNKWTEHKLQRRNPTESETKA